MIKYEDFPRKCLKCHNSNIPLERFPLAHVKEKYLQGHIFSRVKRIAYSSFVVRFPVCKRCKKQFTRYRITRSILMISSLLYLLIIPLTIVFLIYPNYSFQNTTLNLLPLVILMLITVILTIIVRTHPHRIKKFITITKDGKVVIKDPSYEKEVYEYQAKKAIEDRLEINKIHQLD